MADIKISEKAKAVENTSQDLIIMKKVIQFLQFFLPVTLAKRLVAIVLLAAGIPVPRVTELTGLCDRSTRGLLKSMREEDVAKLLCLKSGSGKKSKTFEFEAEILKEIEKNKVLV